MRISIPAAATACLAVALAGACRTRSRHSTDLLAQSWRAEVNFERVGKSLLTDDGDPNMVSGWVGEEMTPTGRLIWAIGPESSLRFHLNSPRALRLKLSATAYEPALAGKSQNMEIQLNHHSIGKMTFSADTASNLTLELPAELLQMGSNELRLLHPWSARPGEATIKDDMRPLSVGFTQLDLMELDETQRPDAQSLKPDWSGAWYDPETDPDIGAFRWAPTEGTALLFNSMPGVTGYRLSCQLLPYQPKGAPPQFVEFRLNGVLMERRRLAPGWQTVAISLLNDKLRPGLNVIDLKAEHGLSPLAAGEGKDTRVLAFALGARLLTPLSHTSFPSGRLFTHPQGGLSLPTTARLAYTMELLAGASFEVEGDAEMPALIQLSCRCNTDHEARHEAVKVQGHFLRSMKACSAPGLAEVSVSANAIQGTPPVHLSRFNLYTRETPLLWAEQPPRPPVAPVTKRPKTIIISLVDTLRADRLSVYGYSRATSPALAAFAREATVFDNAWSTTSWTKSAVASLLTGADPDIHSAGEALSTLNSRVPYLPALFKPAGYHSAAVITSGYVGPEFGFARDWDEFHYLPSADGPEPSSVVANRMLARILETAGDAPLLIYLHTVDPHFPYKARARHFSSTSPPSPADQRVSMDDMEVRMQFGLEPKGLAELSNQYDDEVLTADAGLGEMVAVLKKAGRWEDALVVFTADHGEEFGDHGGLEHGKTLFPEVTRIPLLVRWPGKGQAGTVRHDAVSLFDVAPTLLNAAGLPAPTGPGYPLQGQIPARPLIERLTYQGRVESRVLWGDWDYHRIDNRISSQYFGRPLEYLFNRKTDLAAGENHLAAEVLLAGYLRALSRVPPREQTIQAEVNDPETLKNLKALGYLQ